MVGLGTWQADTGIVGSAVQHAIKAGYRHIDCASVYKNEKEVGGALKAAVAGGSVARSDLWITSKLWCNSMTPARVREACLETLADLQLDFLDLYLIHWPVAFAWEPENESPMVPRDANGNIKYAEGVSLRDTWHALEALVDEGKIKHLGVSNFNAQILHDLLRYARHRPITNQVELNPSLPQVGLLNFCKQSGVILTAYCPLGHGNLLSDPGVQAIAEKEGCSAAQLLLKWGLQRGTVVIPKSVHHERIEENLAAASLKDISAEDMEAIAALPGRPRICNPKWYGASGVFE